MGAIVVAAVLVEVVAVLALGIGYLFQDDPEDLG